VNGGAYSVLASRPSPTPSFVTITSTEDGSTSSFAACVPLTSASTVTPEPGQSDTTAAPGFADGETVNVTLHSTPVHLTSVIASTAGLATAKVTIPKATAAGQHHLIFTGATSHHVVTIPITVTPKPQAGLLHLVTPKSLYAKKVKHSASVKIAGHGGLPAHGARHVLVLVEAATAAKIGRTAIAAHSNKLLVVPASTMKITVSKPGAINVVALGWYAAKASSVGDVYRPVKPSTLRKSGTLRAGTDRLPFEPALDGVVLTVRSRRSGTKIGGVVIPASAKPTVLVVSAAQGVVAVHLAKGAMTTVTGWYGAPDAAPGGSTTG
jgi:hypothetical protein